MRRRQFIHTAVAGFPAIIASRQASFAAEYDLVIRGGRVIDPAQKIDRNADVAVKAGKIVAVKPGIPVSAAEHTIDAGGKLVVPGLIDIHVHAGDPAFPPSEDLKLGTTSMVDAGSRGADNVEELIEVARKSPNRMRILINIARLGNNPGGRAEFLDSIEPADVAKCRAMAEKHKDFIVGIKARLSKNVAADRDLEVLRRARQVADAVKIPIMIHMGDTNSPLPPILAMMRPGDIVSHMYASPHGILDDRGQILPEVLAARKRGVRFDFGNGRTEHWTWDVAERALKQGFAPDTLSTDLNLLGHQEQVIDLPNVMSKFLLMGMPLNQVIACVTANTGGSIKEFKPYGTLRTGAAADITVLEMTSGNFDFVDNYKGKRSGPQRLVARAVVMGGKTI